MTTFREMLSASEKKLCEADLCFGHGYFDAHDEAVALVLAAADLPETTGPEILDRPYLAEHRQRLEQYLRRRIEQREPVAYITGWGFLGPLKFRCDDRALVPRSPLMEVIGNGFEPWWRGGEYLHVIDVCCGGGSLGLLVAYTFPDATVTLTDIDDEALGLARENIALHQFPNVGAMQADLLSPLNAQCADIILANPPYVDAEDMASLPPEYRHEPRLALAAGDDGLNLVHRLLAQAAQVLRPGGCLFLEVGNSWPALEAAYPNIQWTWLELAFGGHGVAVVTQAQLQHLIA